MTATCQRGQLLSKTLRASVTSLKCATRPESGDQIIISQDYRERSAKFKDSSLHLELL